MSEEEQRSSYKTDEQGSSLSLILGLIALILTACNVYILGKQAKERELASYRERLFSEDPSARIAAAMSLSKYPREAIWLVNRWAREHKLLERVKSETEPSNVPILRTGGSKASDHEQVKKAIEDALGIMAEKRSWDWSRLKWVTFWIPSRFVFWRKTGLATVSFPLWPCRVRGPRLDRLRITIDVGPIPLLCAYLYESILDGVNLQGADLWEASVQGASLVYANLQGALLLEGNLQGTSLEGANLQGTTLTDANLQRANLELANLKGAFLMRANLQRGSLWGASLPEAFLMSANIQEADLMFADLQGTNLEDANLQGANLTSANLRDIQNWKKVANLKGANIFGVVNPPAGFPEWALSDEVGAVSMKSDEWKKWKEQKKKEGPL